MGTTPRTASYLIAPPPTQRGDQWLCQFEAAWQASHQPRTGCGAPSRVLFSVGPALITFAAIGAASCAIDLFPFAGGIEDQPHGLSTYHVHAGLPQLGEVPLSAWEPSDWYRGLAECPRERAKCYRRLIRSLLQPRAKRPAEVKTVHLRCLSVQERRRHCQQRHRHS